ncbi:MAG: hypothetical protein KKD48_00325 [Nanoarchaeota archaeon]|nr:hypothetical protein [Nanoarchaeota archaeon]
MKINQTNKQDELLNWIEEHSQITELPDTKEELTSVLCHLNFARVFVFIYQMKCKEIGYTRRELSKMTGISPTNLNQYLTYFLEQGLIKIVKSRRFGRRMSIIFACNSPDIKWEELTELSKRVIIDKTKRVLEK